MNKKIIIVVQCRYNSSRLRGKALYAIAGIPMLVFLLRRLQGSLPPERYQVVLATTNGQDDDVIAEVGAEEGVPVVRGDEENVLGRYIKCLDSHPSGTIVRVTADNPLTCPEMLEWIVGWKEKSGADYVLCENLPCGAGTDAFSADLLRLLDKKVTDPGEREHVNLHILRNPKRFRAIFPRVEGDLARPDIRMTVDTKEDWQRVESLFSTTEIEPWKISLRQAIERMDKVCV
ncbi:MAG: hypothetical protein KAR47_12265 [Planctomycetes bacterium]|nr:hypothetical protein [Planctomycetota bacterium]